MTKIRFIQLGDTHIQDTVTREEYYAPCEQGLLDLLNDYHKKNETLKEWSSQLWDTVHQLWKENRELKQKLGVCEKMVDDEWGVDDWEEFYREHGVGDLND